jgi:hypothetical protein
MMDIYLEADPPMKISSVFAGPAIVSSGKTLSTDPQTGNNWFVVNAEVNRILALSSGNTDDFLPGEVMTVTFVTQARLDGSAVQVALKNRSQVFAPDAADISLQITPYDTPIFAQIDW